MLNVTNRANIFKLHLHIITHLNSVPSMKIFNSRQHPKQEGIVIENFISFNPPCSVNVKTNIGRILLCFIGKHFPRHHKYRKLFNRNNAKISYSCMPNMASVIQNHNTSLLKILLQLTKKNAAVSKNQNVHWTKSVYLDI